MHPSAMQRMIAYPYYALFLQPRLFIDAGRGRHSTGPPQERAEQWPAYKLGENVM